ncbi:MAG: helix-turn-helix transcriptional regulator [Peptostreptococcus sp.]|uniref:helix-turn-helix transcriptional regulator n=1 Tax=Peptostreptococcus sp. TaxID=1262 RepID=UPI00290FC0A4|nr:helix-turn-helix transcriptional regulator [Peptostreptococcus sp.]MDU5350007.1 helix-turn-helix transcriptional regulator [Peptostreptococcus sp.]MDU5891843.1 helix-turn-helix transcriptional regulator [Peptostreptococcus sp.]
MFGTKLKELRVEKDISTTEMAAILGVTPRSYNYYERGDRFPRVDIFISICKTLNCTPNDLLLPFD